VCGKSSREPGQEGTWTLEEDIDNLGMHQGDSIYIVDVASDSQTPGCGAEGDIVTFQVAGEPANEQGPWVSGLNPLNLTIGEAPATVTPEGQTPNAADEDTESGIQWWIPAAGGGGAVVLLGLAAAVWRRRRQV
jgi:MYXO-CTERM domain-containing protein